MTPWQNERWATAPTNDGRNFAPAHRWAIMPARPLCFGRVKTGAGIGELVPGCREEFECRGCLFEGSTLRPSELSLAEAMLRAYIREAHELHARIAALEAENAALRSMLGICRKCKIGGMMCGICERRIESEECGCGGDA